MALHLVGESLDARQAHLRARAGALTSLVRGVYVDAADDVEATVLGHAVRIARHLYPRAYLAGASAVLLGPTADGRLFLAGRRNQRTRLRTLEIVQNEAPAHPSLVGATVGDDMGEMRVEASSPRQRFLEAFRLRSEHAAAIGEAMRAQMAQRLVEEHGSPRAAADAVWLLARDNGWYREGEHAERYLLTPALADKIPSNKAALDLLVAWHGEVLGRLSHDGFEWRWRAATRADTPPLIRQTVPGKLPAFVESLLPEGWLARVLQQRDERDALRAGRRYLSNIAIVHDRTELEAVPADVLQGKLASFSRGGAFTGRYDGPQRAALETTFEQNLASLFRDGMTPRLSGVQIKAPMCLTRQGVLVPAVTRPFTHILKPAGTAGFERMPIVEWLCLELARIAGFEVPAIALMEMPDGMPPALIVERFDIRRAPRDRRMIALEDFCSVLDLPASAKYDGTIERMARGLRPLSTDPAADLEILLKRALFAWLVADGDMHLKNLALLRIARPGERHFSSVRFAPLYDSLATRVFPGLAQDRMALKLNGKDDRPVRQDFLALARTIDLPVSTAERLIDETAAKVGGGAADLSLPRFARSDASLAAATTVRQIAKSRAALMTAGRARSDR
jgi:serine/threonine-protein kinase HipA